MGTLPATTLGHMNTYTFTKPSAAPMTSAEKAAVRDALFGSGAMPAGFSVDDWEGRVKLTDTGEGIVQTGERAWVVTVKDDPDDLSMAKLFLDGQLIQTATQANGRIIERAGIAIATLNALVPAEGQNFMLKIEWISTSGFANAIETPVEGW